jgi:hypothetical protein
MRRQRATAWTLGLVWLMVEAEAGVLRDNVLGDSKPRAKSEESETFF